MRHARRGQRPPSGSPHAGHDGVHLLGGSRRHVSRLPDYLPETCRRVGVFVNPEIGYVQERLKTFRLDLVQLHGMRHRSSAEA